MIQELIQRVADLTKLVTEVREAMYDPDKTLLGKTLVGRANTNAANIAELGRTKVDREDFERLEGEIKDLKGEVKDTTTWRNKMEGSVSFVRMAQVILGIITALLGVWMISGGHVR